MFRARTSIVRPSCASTEERTWTRHRADPNRRRATWPRPCCAWRRTPPCLHPLADRDARARRGRRGASPGRPGPDCPSGPHRRRSDRPTGPLAGSRRSGHNHGTITTTPGRSDPRGALHWTSRDSHRGRRHNRPGQSERRCALRSDRPNPFAPMGVTSKPVPLPVQTTQRANFHSYIFRLPPRSPRSWPTSGLGTTGRRRAGGKLGSCQGQWHVSFSGIRHRACTCQDRRLAIFRASCVARRCSLPGGSAK